jgi:AcrR family transcriptional regulator
VTSPGAEGDTGPEPLAIRPPLQRRSREAWSRVLDAGVSLLEEGGYEAFTIAAVCARAQVPPRAIYARAASKDALFLAVYEHGMAHVRAEHALLAEGEGWRGLAPAEVAERAVREVAGIFTRHAALLRSVVLISGVHPEVNRRGALYSRELGDAFTALLLREGAGTGQPDPEAAVWTAFNAVFAALVLRTAYGPGFAVPAADEETFTETLAAMVRYYLFPR